VVLNYAEIKALAMGDPRIKEKMDLDIEINKLSVLKSAWSKQRYSLQDSIVYSIPKNINSNESKIEAIQNDIKLRDSNKFPDDEFSIILENTRFTEKEKAGELILLLCARAKKENWKQVNIGTYKGFDLKLEYNQFFNIFNLYVNGSNQYTVELGGNPLGNITRIDNTLGSMEQAIQRCRNQLVQLNQDLETAKAEYEKPWRYEEEYKTKLARQAELNIELDLNKQDEVLGDESSIEDKETAASNTSSEIPDEEYQELEI
jgi:hypothetical protein